MPTGAFTVHTLAEAADLGVKEAYCVQRRGLSDQPRHLIKLRAFKRLVCRALIGAMVSAQLAVASYACPGMQAAGQQMQEAAVSEPMPAIGDPGMDRDQMPGGSDDALPNVCAQHCHYGQQTDQTQTPSVPGVVLTSLYAVPQMSEASPPILPAWSAGLLAALSPPHTILHCCLRD